MNKILSVLAVVALASGSLCQESDPIVITGESEQKSHTGYVIGIIAFIAILELLGLGVEFWYKNKLNHFLANSGDGEAFAEEEEAN